MPGGTRRGPEARDDLPVAGLPRRTRGWGRLPRRTWYRSFAKRATRHRIGKVVLGGGSMGGTSVLIFAALHPDLSDGVVSQNGTANLIEYERFQDSIRRSYGGTKQERPDEYRKRSPEFAADKLTMPIAFTTGGQDSLVPPDSVLRLAKELEKSNPALLLLHRDSGGHATDYDDTVRAYEFVVQRVLARDKGP